MQLTALLIVITLCSSDTLSANDNADSGLTESFWKVGLSREQSNKLNRRRREAKAASRDLMGGGRPPQVSGQVLVELARSLSAGLNRNMAGQQAFLRATRANISAVSSDLASLRRDVDECCQRRRGEQEEEEDLGQKIGQLAKRVLLLEDRRSLDEAVWLFNTVVCNASIEVLRAEVAGIREERRADRGRGEIRRVSLSDSEEEEGEDDEESSSSAVMNDESTTTKEKKDKLDVVRAKVGGKVVLKCGVEAAESSDSSVVWKRRTSESSFFELLYINGFVFSPELSGRSSFTVSAELSLAELSPSDSGVYLCDVSAGGQGQDRHERKQVLIVEEEEMETTITTTTTTETTTTTTIVTTTEAAMSDAPDAALQIKNLQESVTEMQARLVKVESEVLVAGVSNDTSEAPSSSELKSLWSAVTELRRSRSEEKERQAVLSDRLTAIETLFFQDQSSSPEESILSLRTAIAQLDARIAKLERDRKDVIDEEEEEEEGPGDEDKLSALEKALLEMDAVVENDDDDKEDPLEDEFLDQVYDLIEQEDKKVKRRRVKWGGEEQEDPLVPPAPKLCRARSDPSSSPPPLPGQDEWCQKNCRPAGGTGSTNCPENLCWCPN